MNGGAAKAASQTDTAADFRPQETLLAIPASSSAMNTRHWARVRTASSWGRIALEMFSLPARAALAGLLLAAALASVACQSGEGAQDGTRVERLPTAMASRLVTPTVTPTATPTATPTLSPTATAMATPIATATATPVAMPSPAPTEAPPPSPEPPGDSELVSASLDPAEVKQGGVFVVRVRNSSPEEERTVWFAAVPYPMLWAQDLWWTVVGVAADFAPGEHWVQISDGEDDPTTLVLTVMDAGFPEEYIELGEEESDLLTDWEAIEAERQTLAATYAVVTPERLWSGLFILPVDAPLGHGFGYKRSFNGGPFTHHTGQDIAGTEGQAVVAANSGRVALAAALHLRGNTVIIDHGSGVFSGYHHLSEILVAEGQEVAQGDTIGTVGDTGLSTAPHLHWEMVVQGTRVDPIPWTQAEVAP